LSNYQIINSAITNLVIEDDISFQVGLYDCSEHNLIIFPCLLWETVHLYLTQKVFADFAPDGSHVNQQFSAVAYVLEIFLDLPSSIYTDYIQKKVV